VTLLATGQHSRQESLDAVDDAPQIYLDIPVPVRVRVSLDVAQRAHAGVVTEYVNAAEYPLTLVRGRLERASICHIQLDEMCVVPGSQLGFGGIEMVGADIGDDDLHARAQKN